MMVDPMFWIAQNLRYFPTAVTPTDVAPTAVASTVVILNDFTRFYINLSDFT